MPGEFLGLHMVYLFSQISQGSEYVSGCNYGKILNIPGFQVYQVSAYASVTQGFEYA